MVRNWNKAAVMNRRVLTIAILVPVFLLTGLVGVTLRQHPKAATAVPGQSYQICGAQSAQYLTSPWTYHALASGTQTYTVAQYQALPGYGTTLPPLPSYIASQASSTTAAAIYAPGANVSFQGWQNPETPILHFFEGGAYGQLSIPAVNGDVVIGGSFTGFPEPTFNDGGSAAGVSAQNDTYGYSANPSLISHVSTAAAQGATTVSISSSTIPLMQWGSIRIGGQGYTISAISGTQSGGYTLTITGGLDVAAPANTSVYYGDTAGAVTVSYLDISNDLHDTTGTIYTGAGWTISHNKIHDSYSATDHGAGVAIYGGDEGIIEYNCLSKMGDYGVNIFGHNNKFRMNEVTETNYEVDNSGNGQSGGGKWWGTLNADITDNAWINDSPGGSLVIWLDNGNSGTNISGNFFDKSAASAIHQETGFNLSVTNNLFQNGGWGSGSGCGDSNCVGSVNLNSSGGFHVPGSRYDNQIIVSNNQFINNWGGVSIWQSGGRSCENSGEGWPEDAAYCSGGFPITSESTSGGAYYFSHRGTSTNQVYAPLIQAANSGSSTIMVTGALAINDQVGFSDPVNTTTTSTTNVTALNGSQSINAAATGSFPSSGQIRVGTSAAWDDGNGSWTGAILSYTGKTATSFTGVSFVRGSGTLAGPVEQVLPYKVVSQTCYANGCQVNITPALTSSATAGTDVKNSGTCQLFATSAATPTNPLAPDGTSYFDGCQWGTKNISITGNTFNFDAAAIAAGTTVDGHTVGANCTSAHANSCGTNFQAFQEAGEAPFQTLINGNSMMSNSNFTTCPTWDSNCTNSPLKNINSLSNAPNAPASNGEPPNNIIWSGNTYTGSWLWNVYWYGSCGLLPSDPATGHTMPSGACSVDLAHFQSNWQQETGTSPTPPPPPPPPTPPPPTPPPPPSGKVGDFNSDNNVNITDLSVLLTAWGTNNSTVLTNLNQTGTVNITSLSIFLTHWGT